MLFSGSITLRKVAKATAAGMVVAMLTSCGWDPGATNDRPTGGTSSRAAVTAFLHALERRDAAGMRRMMTPHAQQDEATVEGGLLQRPPKLASFDIRDAEPEDPGNNASPLGSIASLRYTVALTPPGGFDDDDTVGSAYRILVSETRDKRWLVAELGGCC